MKKTGMALALGIFIIAALAGAALLGRLAGASFGCDEPTKALQPPRNISFSIAVTVLGGDDKGSPIFVNTIPSGHRDRRLISVAPEKGGLDDLRAIPGNDLATKSSP